MDIRIENANIITAFHSCTIGTKVTNLVSFWTLLVEAIEKFDFASQRVPGQGFLTLPDLAIDTVSAGVGKRTKNTQDYIARIHRDVVTLFLKREKAEKATGVACVVYTKDAYLSDPDVANSMVEVERINRADPTHILVAVLAFAGPKPPLPLYRLVHNLAGGNKEALVWTADEIRAKAKETLDYENEWCTVADY